MGKERKSFLNLSDSSQRRHKAYKKAKFHETLRVGIERRRSNFCSVLNNQRKPFKSNIPEKVQKLRGKTNVQNLRDLDDAVGVVKSNFSETVQSQFRDVETDSSEKVFQSDVRQNNDTKNCLCIVGQDNRINDFFEDVVNILLIDNTPQTTTTKILHSARNHFPNSKFPLHAKTAYGSPRKSGVKSKGKGKYIHFGMENAIIDFIAEKNVKDIDKVDVQLATDGIPIYDSNDIQLWPILGRIIGSNKIFVIGCYSGKCKPEDSNEFLSDTVNDFVRLGTTGFVQEGKKISVIVHSLICDIPAKSMVQMTKGHTGYNSCPKCKTRGEYDSRVCFPLLEFELRTDEDIIQQTDEEYHQGKSILLQIPGFSYLKHVPFDYMHLVLIGVVKKLFKLWLSKSKKDCLDLAVRILIDSSQISIFNEYLDLLAKYCPVEFRRKVINVENSKSWKATQFRLFLLYIGPVALRVLLS